MLKRIVALCVVCGAFFAFAAPAGPSLWWIR